MKVLILYRNVLPASTKRAKQEIPTGYKRRNPTGLFILGSAYTIPVEKYNML